MGVKERKAREKEALRNKIIDTATDLFLKNGYEGTSIRMIARDIEYSPATIYLYFRDKSELFTVIMEKAYTLMNEYMATAKIIADPYSRLQEICKRYVSFAGKQPLYYDLIFIAQTPFQKAQEYLPYTEKTSALFVKTIEDCKRNGYFISKNAETLALSIWSYLHGLVALRLKSRLDHINTQERSSASEQSLITFLSLLQSA